MMCDVPKLITAADIASSAITGADILRKSIPAEIGAEKPSGWDWDDHPFLRNAVVAAGGAYVCTFLCLTVAEFIGL